MTARIRIFVVALWALSLVGVAHWSARAQVSPQPGYEVRFIPGTGKPGSPSGTLVVDFGGQWLPVTLDMTPVPDGNSMPSGR